LSQEQHVQDKTDSRVTGKYPLQQEKVLDQILERREYGKAVSTVSISKRMRKQCEKDLPIGYDSAKDKFKSTWSNKFMKSHGLSVRRGTNIKGTSIFERRHRIENYHWWVQFGMRLDPISSESESESESGGYVDTIPDGSGSESESESESSSSMDSKSSDS